VRNKWPRDAAWRQNNQQNMVAKMKMAISICALRSNAL